MIVFFFVFCFYFCLVRFDSMNSIMAIQSAVFFFLGADSLLKLIFSEGPKKL